MAKTVPRKENLSGHVCFDVPQTRFFQENYAKVHDLETRRRHGMVENARERNPLNAEKSPRRNDAFEYRPPAGKVVEEKWNYPESDWGLMAKFRSQAKIYDDIFQKEKEYQKRVDSVASIRADNQRMIQDEFDRQKHLYDVAKKRKDEADRERFDAIMGVDTKDNHAHSSKDNGPDELDLALQKDAQAVKDAERERARKRRGNTNIMLLKPEPVPPKDFYHTKITTFRVISDEHQHPEVLAEWRAKRAADYVSKHPNALEPPPHRAGADRSFRPGGILPAKTGAFTRAPAATKKTASTSALSTINLNNLDINVLTKELKKTEEEMQRQQLKIKLNTKQPKRFEVPKNERRRSTTEPDSPY